MRKPAVLRQFLGAACIDDTDVWCNNNVGSTGIAARRVEQLGQSGIIKDLANAGRNYILFEQRDRSAGLRRISQPDE